MHFTCTNINGFHCVMIYCISELATVTVNMQLKTE